MREDGSYKLDSEFGSARAGAMSEMPEKNAILTETDHWNSIEARARSGERLFWLNHPRVAYHYSQRALVEGKDWREWAVRHLGGPARLAVELGCGQGEQIRNLVASGYAEEGIGIDLDACRFGNGSEAAGGRVKLIAQDVNSLVLAPGSCDLIYALQSFHHFSNLEHIMEAVERALTPNGLFVLEEFAGPAQFQWTDQQLRVTKALLGLMPVHLRRYANGIEKRAEGRSTPEEVMRVCPSEAIRSDEIVPLFHSRFQVLHHLPLGGTIQHILYSGIIHNFPDGDEATDHLIDCVAEMETILVQAGVLPSDFVLLIGRKKP